MLQVRDLVAAYGPIVALHGVSLDVPEGSIVAVLGANGAGKSSTLRVISGLLRAKSGSIKFDGQRIDHLSTEQIVSLGMSHVPEGRQLFGDLTVLENLRLGAYSRFGQADGGGRLAHRQGLSLLGRLQHDLIQAATGGIRDLARAVREHGQRRRDFDAALKQIFDYFPILAQRKNQVAGTLSGGEQQMLAIGRGLMARPRLLLLDEPSMGLAPLVTREIFEIVQTINRTEGVTILVVEQNANLALEIAHYGYVLETGRVALADTSENLRKSEAVRRSYLGQ
ncbi:MAG: ABC transporter ATP-binding protein [Dehalococcoidia bacterium]|nr:ABC transporter ATP-binding protein [Dehalococcoidia bacterium]